MQVRVNAAGDVEVRKGIARSLWKAAAALPDLYDGSAWSHECTLFLFLQLFLQYC